MAEVKAHKFDQFITKIQAEVSVMERELEEAKVLIATENNKNEEKENGNR